MGSYSLVGMGFMRIYDNYFINFKLTSMKIIEALKEIPLIEKKIQKNNQDIVKYSSYCNKIGCSFKDKNEQEKQVTGLVQSNVDLCNRRLSLKRVLNKTNSTLILKIEDRELTVTEWIEYKNVIGNLLASTYNSMSTTNGINQMQQAGGVQQTDVEKVMVERCFDEKVKNSGLEKNQTVIDKITGALEVFNATTDLIESV